MARNDIARRTEPAAPAQGRQMDAGALSPQDALLLRRMAIAMQRPRDEVAIRQKLKALAGGKYEEWGYAWPVQNKRTNRQEIVAGPSIKCANAVLANTPNLEVRVSMVEAEGLWVFEATLFDLENNNSLSRTYRQRRNVSIMSDEGRNDDLLFALGQSKAIRNTVVNYLPELVDFAWEESRKSMHEAIKKNVEKFRADVGKRLASLNVNPQRVVQWVGRGVAAWTVEDLAQIITLLTAIKEGVTTPEKVWPDLEAARAPAGPPPPPAGRGAGRGAPAQPPPRDEIPDGPDAGDANDDGKLL